MAHLRRFAALAAAASPGVSCWRKERRRAGCEETNDALPAWLLPGGLPKGPNGGVRDVSRKDKIDAFERTQNSSAAQAHNSKLPKRPEGPGCLRLASYNLHFHTDSKLNPSLPRALEAIKIIDADVVALQEAGMPPCLEKSGGSPSAFPKPTEEVEDLMKMTWSSLEEAVGIKGGGSDLLEGMRRLGYSHCVWSPLCFMSGVDGKLPCGNAVFSKRPLLPCDSLKNGAIILDKKRANEDRCAAVAVVDVGGVSFAVASTHLDVWAEMRGYFGMAEGEAIRLLEFENLHHALEHLPNIAILGDFNTPSRLSAECSPEHARIAELLDCLSKDRDPQALRHFLPRGAGRLPEAMTALGFAEQRLGYKHCWQELDVPRAPVYSHWSGQLIDHCLLRVNSRIRVTYADIFHTDASDHLPLVIDVQVCAE
eukprot:TRINITY_DN29513_c0_g1_i1.p1 TRINITY_DN29513_c0_g1~~TRINITY_DN29513_c0_g1_i1.p1  ORF type:complete len:424 (-),score=104.16 TRINITY_DN29513_c0_g1_i1:38-1309(-)